MSAIRDTVYRDNEHDIHIACVFGLVVLSSFSPIIAYYAGVVFLLVCSTFISKSIVRWVGYVSVFSACVSAASRKTMADPSDDFSRYYAAYSILLSDGWQSIDIYGKEFGLALVYYLLSITGLSSQILPLFIVALICSVLFVLWIDKFGYKFFPLERYGSVMAMSLLFFGYVMSTQITRQFISSCLLLFAISIPGWRGYIWLFGAALFHQTALPFYIFVRSILKYGWLAVFPIIIVTYLIVFNFQDLIQLALLATPDTGDRSFATKFIYYSESDEGMTSADLSQIRFMLTSCIISIISLKYIPKGWLQLIVCATIMYIILLPIPLLSLRMFTLFTSVLTGYIFSFLAYRVGWTLISWCGGAYVALKIYNQLSVDPLNPFALWDKFDSFGFFPFYYLFKI